MMLILDNCIHVNDVSELIMLILLSCLHEGIENSGIIQVSYGVDKIEQAFLM